MGDRTSAEQGKGNESSLRADVKQRLKEQVGENQADLGLEHVRQWELGVH